VSCHATQRSIRLDGNISYSAPNFPNFRLGALTGSVCDTLVATQERAIFGGYDIQFYPNPASENLNIEVSMPDFALWNVQIALQDLLGNLVYQAFLPPFTSIHKVDTSLLANGVYIVSLKMNEKTKISKKVILLH
jgi:hypothetical protein